jgi:hypothetical protein
VVVERVALLLYNSKCSIADAYDAIGNKNLDIGPYFPFNEARLWMEEKGYHSQLGSVQRVDASTSTSVSLENLEGIDAAEDEAEEQRSAIDTLPRPIGTKQAKRRKLDAARFKTCRGSLVNF